MLEDLGANKIPGIHQENIFFLGYDDGMPEYVRSKEIVEKVCWFIRKYRPDAVFTMDRRSKYSIEDKTDHRASAFLTVDGARAAAYHESDDVLILRPNLAKTDIKCF